MIKKMFNYIVGNKFSLIRFKLEWRRANAHNHTTAGTVFPMSIVKVGEHTYGPLNVYHYGEDNAGLTIGNLCSVALDVKFILGGNHFYEGLLSYPVTPMLVNSGIGSYSKGTIAIGHDCWIGFGSVILSGVTLGNGCIVAAGSVVTKSFPPYSIIGGNPAKCIRPRFDDESIKMLENNVFIYYLRKEDYVSRLENLKQAISSEKVGDLIDSLRVKG